MSYNKNFTVQNTKNDSRDFVAVSELIQGHTQKTFEGVGKFTEGTDYHRVSKGMLI